MNINQFEIWNVDLNPVRGSEQNGIRPCAVLQTNAANKFGMTILIAPFTSRNIEKLYPYEVKVDKTKVNNLKYTSKIKLDQIRVIDKSRFVQKMGEIDEVYTDKILEAIGVIFDFERNFR